MMLKSSQKGGVVLKILAVIAFILMILSIEIPRRAWEKQRERTELARKRMVEMADCEIVYLQEAGSFSKDLKEVFDFAVNNDSLMVSAKDIDIEVLDIDSTKVRISFTAVKHIKDLDVKPVGGKLENIEDKEKFIAYMNSIGCPEPEKVMNSSAEEIEMLLKDHAYKDVFRSYKEKYYKSSENETEILYNAGRKVDVSLLNRNPKLKLKSNHVMLSSDSNIEAIANYKGEKDTYWDFISKKKIDIDFKKDPELDLQFVNMARYVFTDIEEDKTPYLCPSTLDPFKVAFNLSARFGMNITFFNKDQKNADKISEGEKVIDLNNNETIKNYFLNIIKLKTEREVADLVREYELDGDSTISDQRSKDSLFSEFFTGQIKDITVNKPYADKLERSIDSPDYEKDKNFSEVEAFKVLFRTSPAAIVQEEMKNEVNIKYVSDVKCFYSIDTLKIDTISVKIESPITENSEFKGYERSFLEQKWLFGISDDEYAGYVDNGSTSWKEE